MAECPDLATLEEVPLPPPIKLHVEGCEQCQLVLDVFAQLAAPAAVEDCLRFDALLAARADGTLNRAGANLLQRHLASCADCRAVAETLSPTGDAQGDLEALPEVDPSAYALGLEVARGGMGRILAARDLRVGRPVAVKELLGRSPQLAARFEREARVTARLQHPGILPIYEIGKWPDGTPFYAMRMVDGRTLREAIARATTLGARLALLPALIAATEAVAFAHGQRVIHRDLTPSNILVGAYGETVVIDWGLAKDLAATSSPDDDDDADVSPDASHDKLTGVGAVIGTAAYMPPEQAHAQPVDERADVYALGAILYHLLAGGPPYRAQTTREVLREVKSGPPRAIDEAAPGAPRDLVSIVGKAMARDPEARYPTARELAEELKRFQNGRMVEAHEYSTLERIARFVRRNRAAVTVTALATLLLAGMATVAIWRILRSGDEARQRVVELLVEEGRTEYVAGNPLRALAYLHEAQVAGVRTPALTFLIDSAAKNLWKASEPVECGSDARFLDFAPDGQHVVVACHDRGQIVALASPRHAVTLGASAAGGFDSIRYSHAGTTIAAWGEDGVVRLFDTSGALRRELRHGSGITFASFTPDDRRIATTGFDGTAKVWDAETGAELRTIVVTTSPVFRHVYGILSPAGKHLFTMTLEGVGKGYDIDTGALAGTITHGGTGFVFAGEPSPDGKLVATCGMDGLAKVWDATTGAHLLTLAGHTDMLWKCMFDPGTTRLLTTSHDGRANVWDLRDGALLTSVSHGDVVFAAHFSADGQRFMTIGVDGHVRVWDTGSGALLASHETFGGKDAGFSRDGTRVVVLRGDGRFQIWDETDPLLATYARPPDTSLLAVTQDGAYAAVERRDGWVELHATQAGAILPLPPVHAPVAVAGTWFAATAASGAIITDTRRPTHILTLPLAGVPSELALSGDGARVVAVMPGRGAEVWTTSPPARVAVLAGAAHALLSHDGHRALTWRDGEPPTVWDLDRRTQHRLAIARAYRPIGFAHEGERVAVVEDSDEPVHVVSLWSAAGVPLQAIIDVSVAPGFDASGRWLTTIGVDHVVSVWDVRDGRLASSFLGPDLQQAQVNADGSLLVAIGQHGTAAMVLTVDGRVLARWPLEHPRPVVGEAGVTSPRGLAWWSPTGAAVSQSSNLAVWNPVFDHALHPIGPLVADNVPWHVGQGQLEWIKVPFRGRVVRAHDEATPAVGVADAHVTAELRRSAYVGSSSLSWKTMEARSVSIHVVNGPDADGWFEIPDLFPGLYTFTITVGGRVTRQQVSVGSEHRDYELVVPD